MVVPIYTIGYGPRSSDEFIAVLARYGIAFLIDVRSRPYSSFKPEFSRDALQANVAAAGLRYVYMGDLLGGQPADRSLYGDDGEVVYERVAQDPAYRRGIERLRRAWEQQLAVAVMCSEAKPQQCHRTKLIGQTLTDAGIDVRHIDENDELKTQGEVLLDLSGGQMYLLPPTFTSRKKYRGKAGDES